MFHKWIWKGKRYQQRLSYNVIETFQEQYREEGSFDNNSHSNVIRTLERRHVKAHIITWEMRFPEREAQTKHSQTDGHGE